MAATDRSSMAKLGGWGRAHPRTAAVIIAFVAFLLGVGAGGSANSLQADLTAAEEEASSLRSTADAEADKVDDLEDRVATLLAKNSGLKRQITRLNAQRELPDLVGTSKANGIDLERRYGWIAAVEYRYSTARPGTVLLQRPAAGTMMRYGARYTIFVAQPLPDLDDVVGMWRTGALRALGRWDVVVVEQVSSRPPGRVIAMTPAAGSALMPGETVTLTVAKKAPPPPPEPVVEESAGAGCTPGYSPCLPPAPDYDCSGGSGDGPKYTGYVTVTGDDPYDLDADGDGAGCES